MAQIYFKKWEYTARRINKISTNFNIFLSFFNLQPVAYRKSPVEYVSTGLF